MAEPLSEQIMGKIEQASQLYHRLMLLVAPAGGGKSKALQEVAERTGFRYVNVNLELSRLLLDLTERQRALQVVRLLNAIVAEDDAQVVLLDNLELLFDIALKQDPLRLLQVISRNRTIVAAWNGTLENAHLIYAKPDHAEYHRYPVGDLFLVTNVGVGM